MIRLRRVGTGLNACGAGLNNCTTTPCGIIKLQYQRMGIGHRTGAYHGIGRRLYVDTIPFMNVIFISKQSNKNNKIELTRLLLIDLELAPIDSPCIQYH
jgi:hypothetical protein